MDTELNQTPQLCSPVETHQVRHKRVFRFSLRNSFLPKGKDHPLKFVLTRAPPWITIAPNSGIISGCTPTVSRDTLFLVTVKASNEYGFVSHAFFIKVICTEVVDIYAQKLIYSAKNHNGQYSDQHPHIHSILQYIYEYMQNFDNKEVFNALLTQNANKLGIPVPLEATYDDFKKVVLTMAPRIEDKIMTGLPQDFILAQIKLTNVEFHLLYRHKHHFPSSFAASAWSYFETPDKKHWKTIWCVLTAAAKILLENQKEQL